MMAYIGVGARVYGVGRRIGQGCIRRHRLEKGDDTPAERIRSDAVGQQRLWEAKMKIDGSCLPLLAVG